jgi:hypothetical protein
VLDRSLFSLAGRRAPGEGLLVSKATRYGPAMDRLEELIGAFRRSPSVDFAPGDLELLERAADSDLWAAKAVMLFHLRVEAFDRCLPLLERIARAEPTSENIGNWAVGLRHLRRYDEAIGILETHQARVDPILFCDLMCSLHGRAGRFDEAVRHGDRALALKDAAAPAVPPRTPRIAAFDPDAPRRNVISFSVWGAEPRYLNGAIANAIVIRHLYPGWTARFYTDGNTPAGFLDALRSHGAEVLVIPSRPAPSHGLFWRFLVEDDPGVDIYLVRDCDSVVNAKERWAVADWLSRGTAFHVMRDHPTHSELILAGMWGAHRGNLGGMGGKVDAWLREAKLVGNFHNVDQHFTRRRLWPLIRGQVTVHDSWFGFGDPLRYDPGFALPSTMHIGQNEWARPGR